MNPADAEAAKIVSAERPSADAAAGPDDGLDEQLRVSVEALLHPSPPPKPVMELDDLLLAITHHLDEEASERKAIYNRLLAIEDEVKRRSAVVLADVASALLALRLRLALSERSDCANAGDISRCAGMRRHVDDRMASMRTAQTDGFVLCGFSPALGLRTPRALSLARCEPRLT
jgi:hypothetical protein